MSDNNKKNNIDEVNGHELEEGVFNDDLEFDVDAKNEHTNAADTASDDATTDALADETLAEEEAEPQLSEEALALRKEKEEHKRLKQEKHLRKQQRLEAEKAKRYANSQAPTDKDHKKKRKGDPAVVKNAKSFGRKLKDVFAELKNVTWPKWKEVAKKLGIVLAFTGSFLVVLMGIDWLMKVLYELLVSGM